MAFEKFHFTADDGAEIVLPSMNSLKGGLLRKYRKLDSLDFLYSIIEEVADEDEIAKLDNLERDELNRCFEKWQKFDGVTFPQS